MESEISLQGAVRVEYRLQLETRGSNTSLIASERRFAGGNGAVAALALASLGASVRLRGNPIGDDAHGRFLKSQLQVLGLKLDIETRNDIATPYAILVRAGDGTTQTWLSPEAARLEGPQDYSALLEALTYALALWDDHRDDATIRGLLKDYDAGFGAPSLKEKSE